MGWKIRSEKVRVSTPEGPVDIPQSRVGAHVDRGTQYGQQILEAVASIALFVALFGVSRV